MKRAVLIAALLVSACANRPLPSSFVSRDTLGATNDVALDRIRHSFQPSLRNTIAFANDLLARAEALLAAGDTLGAITRAQEAATTAGYALAARSARESVRARAWAVEARAWAARGYPGRALVAYVLAGFAADYVTSERAAEDDAEFARTLRDLDQQVQAANDAENAATTATIMAVAGAAAAVMNTVSTQMQAQQAANGSQEMQQGTQAIAQRALETSVQMVATAAQTSSETAALVSRMDEALQRTSADTQHALSLQTPEIATARTPLSQIARFYLEASQGDGRYVRHAAMRLARTRAFRPAGIREAIALLASTCPANAEGIPQAPADPEAPRVMEGRLENGDGQLSSGEWRDELVLDLAVGDQVIIDLESEDFDSLLIVRSPSGEEQTNDDRGDGTLHAQITFEATESGPHVVTATTYSSGMSGAYVMRIGGASGVGPRGCTWSDDSNRALNLVWLLAMRETRRLR